MANRDFPINRKFTLYLNVNGEYVLEDQQEKELAVRGANPDEAVARMAALIPLWDNSKNGVPNDPLDVHRFNRLFDKNLSGDSVFGEIQKIIGEKGHKG